MMCQVYRWEDECQINPIGVGKTNDNAETLSALRPAEFGLALKRVLQHRD